MTETPRHAPPADGPAHGTRNQNPRHGTLGDRVRVTGVAVIVLLSAYGAMVRPDLYDGLTPVVGAAVLVSFLWLVVAGCFGYASAGREDWVGLVPFAVALILRECFTLHSVQEIEIQFAQGPVGRHSVVYPLLQMFFVPLVRDPHRFTMHMNAMLGAFACLAAYLFVRQRLESRTAGFLCALFLATQPLVVRFSPTDGPYALLLAAWFSGLAVLSARDLDGRGMFAGAGLLGIAATARIEGAVFLVAALLVLDVGGLIAAAGRHPRAVLASLLAVSVQLAVHMAVLLPFHVSGPTPMSAVIPPFDWLYEDAVWPVRYNDRVFTVLVWVGALAGVLPRYRLGLLAYIAMIVVLAPVAHSGHAIAMHRLVPACALQALVAGMGAYSLTAWIPWGRRWPWVATLPGAAVALLVLVQNRGELTRPYVFTEEYDLVRRHLVPGGVPVSDCRVLVFSSIVPQDIDIHDFRQVVPELPVVDCQRTDCVAALTQGECFYYVRAAGAYFHPAGVPEACSENGVGAGGDRLSCLNQPSAALERAVVLEPVEVRTIDILPTFPDRKANYPARAEVGLFRVAEKGTHGH